MAAGRQGEPAGDAEVTVEPAVEQHPAVDLHAELAPTGVTVNAVTPMSVDTDMCHNAATYGLYNLPSESWHWSTTGG